MRTPIGSFVLTVALGALLSSCGGGGGGAGGTSTVSGAPANFQAANATITYPASSTAATISNGVSNNRIDAADTGSTITVTTDGSDNISIVSVNFLTGAGTFVHAFTNLQSLTVSLALLASDLNAANTTSNLSTFVGSQEAQAQTLTSSAYGLWTSNNGVATSGAGTFAAGIETTAGHMPTSGTATYNGTTIGIVGSASATAALKGTVQLVANFGTASVATTISGITTQNISTNALGSLSTLSGTATISGNKYSGALSGGSLAGQLNGTFYGGAAQETAGVWSASGGGISALGSYGAK